ncbi:hypothetical protein [Microlunatus ginsengisoli]|uniref:DUF927 domain-containing protein n=1 Tax=Microlunatus ginsengisoli TaxID=363863 RepID=A0ABP7AM67_9ACTN
MTAQPDPATDTAPHATGATDRSGAGRPGIARGGTGRHWVAGDYAPFVTASGADKLATSAVAPLVAAARGCETLVWADARQAAADCRRLGIDKRGKQGRRFGDSLQAGDILVMPWYLADQVARAERTGQAPIRTSIQYRPAVPERDETGRERKYEFVFGNETVLGAHPATPAGWFADPAIPLLVAEGQLKGDSAITGALLASGVTPDQLRLATGETVDGARDRLRSLLAAMTPDRRVCVIAIAGVWNWRTNPEWSMVALTGRDVWVAVDGDVTCKWKVWEPTAQLFEMLARRKANAALLSPAAATPEGGAKVGVDDYLADHGTWDDLLRHLSPGLPPRPRRENFESIGQYRIGDDGTELQVCKPRVDEASGDVVGGSWVAEYPIGGRVVAQTVKRKPTPEEVSTGRFGEGLTRLPPGADDRVEIEISWRDPAGNLVTDLVEGPSDILVETPDRWLNHKPLHLPTGLKLHPAWPPRGPVGQNWLQAVKANREAEVQRRTLWTRMGWVPVPGDLPVFSVGDQVVGEKVEGTTLSAVGELIHNAHLFGVGDDGGADFDDPMYRRHLARDLKATLDAVIAAYTDRAVAAVVLAAGVRAALPMQSNSVVYLVGPPASGKSYSAGVICGFWSRRPGYFSDDALPGSAKDSIAATEANLSVACMWVVDDLAPSSDPRRAAREQSDLDDTIRMVHNGSSRGRMTRDGTPRPVRIPNAMLVATAENESTVESIRQRSLTVLCRKGTLAESRRPTDALKDLYAHDGAPARVTQGLVKMIRHQCASRDGGDWAATVGWVADDRGLCDDEIRDAMIARGLDGGSVTRAVKIGGDLALALRYLGELAANLGIGDDYVSLLTDADRLPAELSALVAANWRTSTNATPGHHVLLAITLALRSGRAHIQSAANPMQAPGDADLLLASRLGWSMHGDRPAPNGPAVGVHGFLQDTDEEVVLLDHTTAFSVAQRLYPELLPAGSRAAGAWQSARDERLVLDVPGTTRGTATTRRRLKGASQRFSGVPVALTTLLDPSPAGDAHPGDTAS